MEENVSYEPRLCVLVDVFNRLFNHTEKTELVTGGDEPIYLPCSETGDLNRIVSTKDYFSSALHEISHWCVAGDKRRALIDYGYWYEPDGRSDSQQRQFEQVEVKPQALEWLLSEACGQRFRLSSDNVSQPEVGVSDTFRSAVLAQTIDYLNCGVPVRANKLLYSLLATFKPQQKSLSKSVFLGARLA